MKEKILDFVFPERCMICDGVMKATKSRIAICPHCAEKLTFLDEVPTCRICGCQLTSSEPICPTCQIHVHYFIRAVACLPYKEGVRHAVLQYKFYGRRDLCRTFARLLYYRVLPFHRQKPFDCVVCTPMTEDALRERGYHHTNLIAEPVAKELGVPFWAEAFSKSAETRKQSLLDYASRFKNVEKAFSLSMQKKAFKGKNILLIDDVLTTGATADALSKLLSDAGAERIFVATVAGTQKEQYGPVTEEDELAVMF